MDNLPCDPYMLLSFVNMKLRDYYDSLEALCEDVGADPSEIEKILKDAGFQYDAENNRFG